MQTSSISSWLSCDWDAHRCAEPKVVNVYSQLKASAYKIIDILRPVFERYEQVQAELAQAEKERMQSRLEITPFQIMESILREVENFTDPFFTMVNMSRVIHYILVIYILTFQRAPFTLV